MAGRPRKALRKTGGARARVVPSDVQDPQLLLGVLTELARVIDAVAKGDLSQTMPLQMNGRPMRGQFLQTARTVNTMVTQLNAFASEVTRVAREVGTEGKLGGQAEVRGVGGTWKDLTDNVNLMAGNLTAQVRGIAQVVTAVANGDLKRKLGLDAKGEIAALADTINEMTDTLATFADQVTTVAREVGVEGKLGGQASVPGAAGTWKDLTDNLNQLASTLTTQVRAIAEVATAVTEGDLTRSIGVGARGEVAVLKDKVNEMIRKLSETTQKNTEQDWLKSNLAKFSRMLQGQRDLETVSQLILSEVAPLVGAHQGAIYRVDGGDQGGKALRLLAGYALVDRVAHPTQFQMGEGLVGQCARDGKPILLAKVPAGYSRISSGLGEANPMCVILLPVLFEGQVEAVIELAAFERFNAIHLGFLEQLTETMGIVLNSIEANMRTEELLKQSQSLFAEAQEASRSKSAFLSMAAHELRTPLSVVRGYLSMLEDGSLGMAPAQWKEPLGILSLKAQELNRIVDDLLLAARVEAGTVPAGRVATTDLRELAREALRRAEPRAALLEALTVFEAPERPVLVTADPDQLGRVLDNLINNALTYSTGRPWLKVEVLGGAHPRVVVEDHGVGIPEEAREQIFERFFRVEDSEIGPLAGTGLGLYIGRGLAEQNGGSLTLERSIPGAGSRFVLRLPVAPVGSLRESRPSSPDGASEAAAPEKTPARVRP